MKTLSADIYKSPDDFETLLFEYEAIKKAGEWLDGEPDYYEVNHLKMKMPIAFNPTGLEQDLLTAIAEDLCVDEFYVKIECIVELFPVTLSEPEIKALAA